MPLFLRVACLALPLVLALPAGARASELSCPNRISIGGLEAKQIGTAGGTARVDAQNRLLCAFAGVNFFASSARPPGGSCPPRALPPAVTGGSGQWRFGTPGSPPSIVAPVQQLGEGCVYGGPSFTLPTLTAWREPPSGESCAPHPRDASRFVCGPAGAAAPGAGATAAPAPGAAEAAGHCPPQLSADTLPTLEWEEGRTPVGFYPPESFILDADSGRLVQANAALWQIQQAMGPAWRRAIFLLSSRPGAQSRLPAGTYSCSYDGPRFRQGRRSLEATIAIACTEGCTVK